MGKMAIRSEIGHIKIGPDSKFRPDDFLNTVASVVRQGESEGHTGIHIIFEQFEDDIHLSVVGTRAETDREYQMRINAEREEKRLDYEFFLQQKAYYESEEGKKAIANLTE